MNRKGFTLIELLAVIVILAIIAVITVPTILGVIEGARKDAAKDKAWGTISAVKLAYTQNQTKDSSYKVGTPVTFNNKKALVGTTEVKASGELPESGTVTIREDGSIIAQNLKFKGYTCSTIKSETDWTVNPNNMVCVKGDGQALTSNVVYIWATDILSIGASIEGISTTTDPSTLGKNHFLKHEIVDNKITSSEVCFIKDGNTHCLKPNEYETSKDKLLEIFGESACTVNDSLFTCDASSVYANAFSGGRVSAGHGSSGCGVNSDGYSHCAVYE